MKRFSTLILSLLLLASCLQKAELSSPSPDGGYQFTFGVTPMEGETKSSFKPMTDDKATSIYMLAYRDGVLDESKSGYFVPASSARADFDNGDVYNLYFLKNTTKFIGDDWTAGELDLHSEANLAQLTYSIESYAIFNETGFPQAGAFPNWVAGDSPTHFDLDRQVARIVLKLKDLEQSNVHLTVKSVTLHQAARKIRPFGASFAAASEDDIISEATLVGNADAADHASTKDILVLQGEGEILLYMLENMQGDLLAGNTDHWNKIPNNLPAEKRGLVTYVDINCSATTQASVVGDIHYGICLGDNTTTNFDIHRNYESSLDVTYVTDNIIDHEWKQTSNGHQKIGGYRFVPDTLYLAPGIPSTVYIYCDGGRDELIDINVGGIYRLSPEEYYSEGDPVIGYNCPGNALDYTITKLTDCYKVTFINPNLRVSNTTPFIAMNQEPRDIEPFDEVGYFFPSVDKYNGVSNALGKLVIRSLNGIFPIQFRSCVVGDDKHDELQVRSNNPMRAAFTFRASGNYQMCNVNTKTVNNRVYYVNGYNVAKTVNFDSDNVRFEETPINSEWQTICNFGECATSGTFKKKLLNIQITPDTGTLYNGAGGVASYGPGSSIASIDGTATWGYQKQEGASSGGIIGNGGSSIRFSLPEQYDKWSGSSYHGLWIENSIEVYDNALVGDAYESREYYKTENGGVPFYVVNGDMKAYYNYITYPNETSGNNIKWAKVLLGTLQSGRDLGGGTQTEYTYKNDDYYGLPSGIPKNAHTIYYKRNSIGGNIWYVIQGLGAQAHWWTEPIGFEYTVYMTINGKTSWPMANRTVNGASW